jgi:hypothetical protein
MVELASATSDLKQPNNSQIICFLKRGIGKEKNNNNTLSKLLPPCAAIKQLGNCPLGHSLLYLTSLNNPVVLPYPVFGLVGRSEAPLLLGLICSLVGADCPSQPIYRIFFLSRDDVWCLVASVVCVLC